MSTMLARVLAFAALASSAPAGASALDDYLRLQLGSWTSAAQAAQDQRYGTAVWHLAEIWRDAQAQERWIYAESWMEGAERPYMQRISRLEEQPDGSIVARRFAIPEPGRFIGGWRVPAAFAELSPGELTEMAGCEVTLVRAGKDRFEGGTQGRRCSNAYKGSAYALSQTVLTAGEMTNWDRGFSADGEQRWGPAAGGYRFRRLGEEGACVKPVRMLVYGEISDRAGFGAYARALAESGLYARFGGQYEAITPLVEVFEGEPPPGRGVVIARWPCLEAARSFWNSPEYREIVKLREGKSRFEVIVLPVPPVPAGTAP
jgi:CpeT protein